jgi:hypothetical protein
MSTVTSAERQSPDVVFHGSTQDDTRAHAALYGRLPDTDHVLSRLRN